MTEETCLTPNTAQSPLLSNPVVAIGASAGGLEALQEFFGNLPANPGGSFVVVQHLSPDYRSMLDELLARHTKMPVSVVTEGTALELNHVYIIPPGRNLVCDGHRLRLLDQPDRRSGRLNLAIDVFFTSIARAAHELVTAVILSGTGSDGSAGLAEVSEFGGLVMVQDPASAKFDGMPASAIHTGLADVIGSPAQLAAKVVEHLRDPHQASRAIEADDTTSQALVEVVALLKNEFGVSLDEYKPMTLLRRLARRVQLNKVSDLAEYLETVRGDRDRLRELLEDLLIGVTSFFRDPSSWEALSAGVIRRWAERPSKEEFRAWVCGCSTGEEAYTLAMLAAEAFDLPPGRSPPIRIFATDVSTHALQVASSAIYPASVVESVSEERLERFFELHDGHYRVRQELRRTVVFAPHDVTRQTPFSRMNLVTCRNMLIYMQPSLQQRVLSLLHYALRPGGALFLGSAEGLLDLAERFRPIDAKARVYLSTQPSERMLQSDPPEPHNLSAIMPKRRPRRVTDQGHETLLDAALGALLRRDSASGLLVSRRDELIRVIGETPEFLRIPVGAVTHEIRELLPKNVALGVGTALHRARSSNKHVWLRNVHYEVGPEKRGVDVSVMPLSVLRPDLEVELVTFSDADGPVAGRVESESFAVDDAAQRRISTLERELEQSRENLQATIEELETTNEEQQATNEELLASNEELQSTNEELHSVNEELHTVNTDYQQKIEQLIDLTTDLDGLLDALDVGIIFLSTEGTVLRYNTSATKVFRLAPVDLNRPLAHLADTIEASEDRERLFAAIGSPENTRLNLLTETGIWRVNVIHLRSLGDVPGRKIITLVDVSDIERVRVELAQQNAIFDTLSKELPDVLWMVGPDGAYTFVSGGFEKVWGRPASWLIEGAERWSALVHPEDRERVVSEVEDGFRFDGFDSTYRVVRDDGSIRWVRSRSHPVLDGRGQRLGTVGTTQDISAQVAEVAARKALLERFGQMVLAVGDLAFDRAGDRVTWRGDVGALGYRASTIGDDVESYVERVHPDDRAVVFEVVRAAAARSHRVDVRFRLLRGDGRYTWVRQRGYAVGDEPDFEKHGGMPAIGVLEVLDHRFGRRDDDELAIAGVSELCDGLDAAHWRWCSSSDEWSFEPRMFGWVAGEGGAEDELRAAIKTQIHGRLGKSGFVAFEIDAGDEPIVALATAVLRSDNTTRFVGRAFRRSSVAATVAQNGRQAEILNSLRDAIWVVDDDDRVSWANEVAQRTGASQARTDGVDAELMRAARATSAPARAERLVEDLDAGPRFVRSTRTTLRDGTTLAVDVDITEVKQTQRALQRRASVDALTGLWLRTRFIEELTLQAARAGRDGASGFAVVFMDLDNFKVVNDSHDHFVGNALLQAFAQRLRHLFRPGDFVARFGGDEFAILVEDIDDYRDALAVAKRIHEANRRPLAVGEREFTVTASIGIAVWDPSRHSPESLLRDADVAMYEAKRSPTEDTVVFDAEMHAKVLRRHETKRDLLEAVERAELQLHMQPLWSTDGGLLGHELLLRWAHPRRGMLTPGAFLELAAETGVLVDVETWVLDEALAIVDRHSAVYSTDRRPFLTVNATAAVLRTNAFMRWAERVQAGGYGRRATLVLEIIEETMIDADPAVRLALQRAKDAGVRIAVDDFGAGSSSLSDLLEWPLDIVKFDRSFASMGHGDPRGRKVVTALVDLARSLEVEPVLEGVESAEEFEFARAVGAVAAQGYHLGRPTPVEDAVRALEAAPRLGLARARANV